MGAAEDEERARARELSRRASENAYGSKRKPSTVFVPGELVLVRAPEKLRDGVDKNLRRLEFIGVFKVMQHDQRLQRVAVKHSVMLMTQTCLVRLCCRYSAC